MTVRLLLALLAAASAASCGAPALPADANDSTAAAVTSEDAAAWWRHVSFLAADEMRGRETGSPEHRKAANYVADQLTRAGVQPAGSNGFLQPVTFRSRRIDESQSSLALVRRGVPSAVVLGEEATFGMRIDPAPLVDAPLVFAGHGLVIPEVEHDDFAGLDVKGKVVVYLAGSPRGVSGALGAHYQSAGQRWAALKRLGAVGTIAVANPRSMDVPWERSAPNRLNPAMALADPSLVGRSEQVHLLLDNLIDAVVQLDGNGPYASGRDRVSELPWPAVPCGQGAEGE